jgi:hypothetical protein
MTSERDATAGVSDDAMLTPATSAVATASTFSEVTTARKLPKSSATWSKGPVWTRRVGLVLAVAAVLLIPWTAWLALRLPSRHVSQHWDIAWVGFDIVLTAMIAATGIALWKRSPIAPFTATAAATLLLVDAWFDIFTARSGDELDWAIFAAALGELPLAVLCFWLVRRWALFRGRTSG